MASRISIDTTARIFGLSSQNLRNWMHRSLPLGQLGHKVGKEKFLDLGEVTMVRVVAEMMGDKHDLSTIVDDVLSLWPNLVQLAKGELGDGDVFAVRLWGEDDEGNVRHDNILCVGADEMCAACRSAVEKGWPNLRIHNLQRVVAETMIAWSVATGTGANSRKLFSEAMSAGSADAADALAILDRIEQRIAGQKISTIVSDATATEGAA